MPYSTNKDLPDSIKGSVKAEAGLDIMREVINSQLDAGKSETVAFASAWAALQRAGYDKNDEGEWIKKRMVNAEADMPLMVRAKILCKKGRKFWVEAYNSAYRAGATQDVAEKKAWEFLEGAGYAPDDDGDWLPFGSVDNDADKTLTLGDVHVPSTEERGIIAKALDWLKGEKSVDVSAINKAIQEQSIIDDYVSKADDIEKAEYQGKDVELNKPFRTPGESKKFAVYVRNDEGNVVIVRFGDSSMEIKRDDPEARANFRARHNCDAKKDKTTAGYWSCRLWSDTPVSDILSKSEGFTFTADILKSDEDQRLVYGWASIIYENGEPVTDSQGDIIAEDDLLEAAHNYVSQYREAKAMHEGEQIGEVVESLVFTSDVQKALGIDLNKVGWFIGMKIHDDEIWRQFRDGSLSSFSVGGRGRRVEIDD